MLTEQQNILKEKDSCWHWRWHDFNTI